MQTKNANLWQLAAIGLALTAVMLTAPAIAQPAEPAIAFVAESGNSHNFVSNLMVMNADGTNRTVILSRTTPIWYPVWSPDLDGNSANGYQGALAITIESEPDPGWDLFLLDVSVVAGVPQGSNLRKIVEDDLDPTVGNMAVHQQWSVDLDPVTLGYQGNIVFTGSTTGGATGSVNLISMAWDGNTVQPVNGPNSSIALIPDAGVALPYPTWSGDGTRIAFGGTHAGSSGTLVVDAESGALLAALTLPCCKQDYEWSRNDSRLAFRFQGDGLIYTVDVELGSESMQALPGAVSGWYPTWSPDDEFIAFSNGGQIRRVDVATGAQTVLASDKKKTFKMPDWRRF